MDERAPIDNLAARARLLDDECFVAGTLHAASDRWRRFFQALVFAEDPLVR
jgi:hypothetical protein